MKINTWLITLSFAITAIISGISHHDFIKNISSFETEINKKANGELITSIITTENIEIIRIFYGNHAAFVSFMQKADFINAYNNKTTSQINSLRTDKLTIRINFGSLSGVFEHMD